MSEQRIPGRDGSVSVVSDSYGTTVVTGPPEPAEDPSKWQSKTHTDDEIKKLLNITQEQLDMARGFLGFPGGTLATSVKFSLRGQRQILKTSAAKVEAWAERVRSLNLK